MQCIAPGGLAYNCSVICNSSWGSPLNNKQFLITSTLVCTENCYCNKVATESRCVANYYAPGANMENECVKCPCITNKDGIEVCGTKSANTGDIDECRILGTAFFDGSGTYDLNNYCNYKKI